MAKAKSWRESGGELGSYVYNIFSGGTKEQAVDGLEASVIAAATVDDASQSKTVSTVTQAVLESGTADPLEMAEVAVSTANSLGETSDVDAKAVASLLTPEGRAEIKRLVNEAWKQVNEKRVEVGKAISELLSKLGDYFTKIGTKISKSVGEFFDKIQKRIDRHAAGMTLGEISGRGMATADAVKYNIKKEEEGSKINVATAKARAAVGAELMEKIDSISGGLKHVEAGQGVEGKPRTLMQDIRDAGGKTKKSQGRE